MSLSDEILAHPGAIAPIRELLADLVSQLGARSAFLVDEAATPFGAFGNVEFPLPHPLSSLTPLLAALLGETKEDQYPTVLVRRVNSRALVTVVLNEPLTERPRQRAIEQVEQAAARLLPLLEASLNSDGPRHRIGPP